MNAPWFRSTSQSGWDYPARDLWFQSHTSHTNFPFPYRFLTLTDKELDFIKLNNQNNTTFHIIGSRESLDPILAGNEPLTILQQFGCSRCYVMPIIV